MAGGMPVFFFSRGKIPQLIYSPYAKRPEGLSGSTRSFRETFGTVR